MQEELLIAKNEVQEKGFLDVDIDPTLDLFAEIERLKKEKNAIILAHLYQEPDIQDIVIPDLKAGCSLSESCPPPLFKKFKEQHPDHVVISYINCSAGIKALTDVICTSSNAKAIVNSFPPEQPIIFAPDKNLGGWINRTTGRNMLLWNGACMVHEIFSLEKITRLKVRHPKAKLIAHPECEEPVLRIADFIGSTTQLLSYVKNSPEKEFIVATEAGILHQMVKQAPDKTFIPAPPDNSCACNDCPHMKRNTLEKVYLCMQYEQPEVIMEE
ncbi:MAG: quinolinate synthase subunit A, partial [Chitinophagaceae bacterium]